MTTYAQYTFEDFRDTFGLGQSEAERIFRITGPAKAKIDAFMKVRAAKDRAEEWLMNVSPPPERL